MQDAELFQRLQILEQLAEQDLLSASASLDPVYWHQQALERLEVYHSLQQRLRVGDSREVLSQVADEYYSMFQALPELPLLCRNHGRRQALEMVLLLAQTFPSSEHNVCLPTALIQQS